MISVFEGRIGGGKTYNAVLRIVDHLARGGTVFTNIEVSFEGLKRCLAVKYGTAMHRSQIQTIDETMSQTWYKHIKWGTAELPTLVILDEAHLFFNSRNWKQTQDSHADMLSFLTQSRKACVDCIFITQSKENIEKQFRILAQEFWSFRDLRKLKVEALGVAFPTFWPFPQMLATCRDYTGYMMSSKWQRYDKLIFRSYQTLAFLDPQMQAEAERQRVEQIEKRKLLKVSRIKRTHWSWQANNRLYEVITTKLKRIIRHGKAALNLARRRRCRNRVSAMEKSEPVHNRTGCYFLAGIDRHAETGSDS